MAFHDRLKQARIKAGLTQAQAANAIGIAKSTYSGYETGKSEPSMNVIANLMRIFEVAPDFLWQDEMRVQFKKALPDKNTYQDEHIANTDHEFELLRSYRALIPSAKQTILMTIRAFAGNPAMQKGEPSAPAM